jgi:hypothetical protein
VISVGDGMGRPPLDEGVDAILRLPPQGAIAVSPVTQWHNAAGPKSTCSAVSSRAEAGAILAKNRFRCKSFKE